MLLLFIGGVIGFTQDQSAVEKWTLTAHLKAAVQNNFQGLCEVVHSRGKNFTEKSISEDEEKIKKVITAIRKHQSFYYQSFRKINVKKYF